MGYDINLPKTINVVNPKWARSKIAQLDKHHTVHIKSLNITQLNAQLISIDGNKPTITFLRNITIAMQIESLFSGIQLQNTHAHFNSYVNRTSP